MLRNPTFNGQPNSSGRGRFLPLLIFLCTGVWVFAQEPQIDEAQMPRIPAVEPEDALDTFEIKAGFQVKLVAHEPDIVDPIAMAFDADGALYVIEMRGYSERRDDRLGRIRLLKDLDGDGLFETSSVFKDGLQWPTGIVCYKGGVFVGATPDLSYFKDNDGDGVSDEERVVFTGFGPEDSRLNMQALFNSFRWGPDNRIWGATASSGGNVTRPDDPSFETVPIRGADFSFDPETLDFRAESGTAQYGMTFDSMGRRYVCSNSRHVLWVAYERNQVRLNPYYELPDPLVSIPQDGAAAPVFRISYDEPWRVVRTRWRVSGVVRGMIEGGGRVSGYFTSASGIHSYWGDALREGFQNNFFVGDVGSNLVHRKILRKDPGRVQPLAIRPDDEQETEFLRSSDNWFRPASFATGPDGCLYICDMYRETIEHPWSLPLGIKQHLDLNSGNDRGRIYRIEPERFQRSPVPPLSEASDTTLIELAQNSGDDWHQTTSRRLLFERGRPLPAKAPPAPFPALLSSESSLLSRFPDWKGDPWLEATLLNSLREIDDIKEAWIRNDIDESPGFMLELARLTGRTGDRTLVGFAVEQLAERRFSTQLVEQVFALKDGLAYSGLSWEAVKDQKGLRILFSQAESIAASEESDMGSRLAGLRLLELAGGSSSEPLRKRIISSNRSPKELVIEAAKGIADTAFLLEHTERLPNEAFRIAAVRFTENGEDATRFLEAIASKQVSLEQIPAEALRKLRQHSDAKVVSRSLEVLPKVESRSDVVARYQSALEIPGDRLKGKAAFEKACALCHQGLDGDGLVFGPPVATFKTAGKASILGNILDPNQEVAPQYQAFQFRMKNGEAYIGMIGSENRQSVTLRLPGGESKTFPRTAVQSMTGVGRSLMPEGLEHSLTVEEMADLLAYLVQ
jgi:putative membrane-bound dehydrogenase-like protein